MGNDGEVQAAVGGLRASGPESIPCQPTDTDWSAGAGGDGAEAGPGTDVGAVVDVSPEDAHSPEAGVRPNSSAGTDSSANPDAVTDADVSPDPDAGTNANVTTDPDAATNAGTSEESAPGPEADSDESDSRPRRSWLAEMVVLVVLALLLTVAVKAFLVQPFRIPSQSMENTLLVNDKVLVDKLVGHVSQIQRGDIIVFNGTGSWNPPSPSRGGNVFTRVLHDVSGLFVSGAGQTYYIKRVIGLPGDHVSCCNAQGLITVNGVALHERAYLYPGSQPSAVRFSVVVPAGRLWVMGDNRADSQDSRFFMCGVQGAQCNSWDRDGTIPENMVVGRAFMIVWPPSRVRLLSVPPTFSQPGLNSPRRRPARSRPHASRPHASRPHADRPHADQSAAGRPHTDPIRADHGVDGQAGAQVERGSGVSAGAGAEASPDGLLGLAADEGMRVVPADPLPLWFAGIGVAVPLTLLERTVRLRRGHGRRS